MGLFDKLFGKSEKKKESPEPERKYVGHKQEWDSYLTHVDQVIGSIMLDLGLYEIAPLKDRSTCIWLAVTMNNPREDGLSSNEESKTLYEIEDELVSNLVKKHNAVFAGRLTSNKVRSFYFYVNDPTSYDRTIASCMNKFANYSYDYGKKTDKDWEGYFDFLYPLPEQYQSMLNRRVIHNMEKNGDDLVTPREVDHFLYFKSDKDMGAFLAAIEDKDFKIINKGKKEDASDEYAYQLNISRTDKIDYQSIDEYVLDLWHLARENNGIYDGWGSVIIKKED
ncbi:MAG: DUF695 domain-containing protein [Candidatus Azobacteroides sp.]|nr:DUF695 domain-containing protein [Candidatus Azobacteroides sp.]